MNAQDAAIVEIRDGVIQLLTTFNPDAACCCDDETGNTLQREDYSLSGWHEPVTNPMLQEDFWGVWTDWNGKMCGGIYLDDEFTYDDAQKLLAGIKHIPVAEIPTAPNGIYVIE